jgi:outer membrane receptor protein involved in Fe transport
MPTILDRRPAGVRAPQFYKPTLAKSNVSYDLNISYQIEENLFAYATYAKSFKSGGINLNGVRQTMPACRSFPPPRSSPRM